MLRARMSNLWVAILLGVGASACWAVAAVAVQRGARRVGTARALLWAQLAGGLALLPLAIGAGDRAAPFTAGAAAWLVTAGVTSLAAYLCMFYAFEHGRLSIAVPIMSSWAVVAAAIGVLLFGERLRPLQIGAAALVVAGVVLASRGSGGGGEAGAAARRRAGGARWLAASLGAAVAFGVMIPALGRVAPATGRLGAIIAAFAVDIALGLPLAALARVDLRPPSRAAWGPVLIAGLLETGGFACVELAAGRAPLAVVSPLASLASPMTVLYAWIVLRERPGAVPLLGVALASAGVVALAL
jgi:drug/metabolite transporter (DMT)-like permease